MKAILILALFVLAASARHNATAFHLGFADQLGLDASQLQDADRCGYAVRRVFSSVRDLLTAQDPQTAILSAVGLYNNVKRELAAECQAYLIDLATIVIQATNATNPDELKDIVNRNFNRYGAQIIQQVAFFVDALADGNDYLAGQTEAYIFQVLVGIETPQEISMPNFNWDNYVPFNQSRFFTETYGTYFTRLGMNTEDVNVTLQCLNELSNSLPVLGRQLGNALNQNTTEQQLAGLKQVLNGGIDTLIPCVSAFKAGWRFGAPYRRAFERAPLYFLLAYVHNVAINLPEIQQLSINQQYAIYTGNYTQAGELLAQVAKLQLDGLNF